MAESEKVCSKKNLGLNHKNPRLFVTSQWSDGSTIYPAYRTFVAAYCCIWIIISGVKADNYANSKANQVKWFIYLTNWAFFLLNVSLIVRAALSVWGYIQIRNEGRRALRVMTWYIKMSWVLYNMSSCVALAVSAAYWGFLWTPEMGLDAIDFHTHGINSILVVLDVLVTAMPIRLLHFYFAVIFGAVYLLFSLIYDLSGGTNALDQNFIYEILDWSGDPGHASLYSLIVCVIVSPALWFVLWCLYKLRIKIYRRFSIEKEPIRPQSFMMDTYAVTEEGGSTGATTGSVKSKKDSVRIKKTSTISRQTSVMSDAASNKAKQASVRSKQGSVRAKQGSVRTKQGSVRTKHGSVRVKEGSVRSKKVSVGTNKASGTSSVSSKKTSVGSQRGSNSSQRGPSSSQKGSQRTSNVKRASVKSINWAYTHEEVESV